MKSAGFRQVFACVAWLLALCAAQPAFSGVPVAGYSIGNRVWYDTDNSGTINGSEAGIDGVSVQLYASGNLMAPLFTTVTANGGYYRFDGLQAGDYIVAVAASNFAGVLQGYWSSGTSRSNAGTIGESAPPGANTDIDSDDNGALIASGGLAGAVASSIVTLGPQDNSEPIGETDVFGVGLGAPDGQSNLTIDFGFYTMALGSLVWNDLDNSGTLNAGEAGIDGVTVELRSGDGSALVATQSTSGGGLYAFTGLPAGNYVVRLPAVNFNPGGVLRDYRSSTGPLPGVAYEPAPDPDTNTADSDDNGTEANGLLGLGGYIQAAPVTLTPGGGSGTANATGTTTENRVDFGVNNSPQIDLVVTKTDGQTIYTPGGTLVYTVVITNNGPADANGMTVSDARPAQIASWSWVCAPGTPAGINCTDSVGNPATFTDTLDLPMLSSVTYTVTAQVALDANGPLTNSVTVTPPPGMTDLTPADNTASDTDTRLAQVDVAATISDGQTTYLPGATLNYVVTISNLGPGSANGTTVSSARPAQIASWTWTCAPGTPAGFNCTGNNANPATFTDSLDLPHGASVTYQVAALVAPNATGDLTASATATAPPGFTDPAPGNNTASDIDTPALTTLAVTKSAAPDPVALNGTLTYTIQVTNTGAVDALNVVATDTLPAGVFFQSASGTGWNCGEAAGVVSCTRASLAPGAAPPIALSVIVGTSAPLTNVVVVTAVNVLAAATATAQTSVFVPPIPALGAWALALLAALLGAAAWHTIRRHSGGHNK